MTKQNTGNAKSQVETFPPSEPAKQDSAEKSNVANIAKTEETKATIAGVWEVDGRIAICETEEQANALYLACFKVDPVETLPACRYPRPTDKVLHYRGTDAYYGRVPE